MAWPVVFTPVTLPTGEVVQCRNSVRFYRGLAYVKASNSSCEFIVDIRDLHKIAMHHWSENYGYAKCAFKRKTIGMAWLLCKNWKPGMHVDHINRIRHDNRSANLRIATVSENAHNLPIYKTNTSGYPGVYWSTHAGMWSVEMVWEKDGKRSKKSGGYFKSFKAACEKSKEMRESRGYFVHPVPVK
jgi:hypothetical protein